MGTSGRVTGSVLKEDIFGFHPFFSLFSLKIFIAPPPPPPSFEPGFYCLSLAGLGFAVDLKLTESSSSFASEY